ncbi:MAG: hypothetical protein ABMA00_08395 [Gemmatimonas sp.]
MLQSIIPNPLHPAIVHLPMAFVVLLPVAVAVAILVIRRGAIPWKVWAVAAAMHAMLALSAWASLATGDEAGEKAEKVIAEAPIESHEVAAETFLALSVGALVIALVGLRADGIGTSARAVAAVGTVVLLVAGWRVGHSGGELVYRYGAASAYTDSSGTLTVKGEGRDDH